MSNTLKGYKDFQLENGSSQGHNLALTVEHVPSLLDSGGGLSNSGIPKGATVGNTVGFHGTTELD